MSTKPKIFTRQYLLLCFSSFLFFSSFNMLIPELPDYLSSMGGEDYKGLIIGIFTLTAGLSRPFSGKLTDTWGRVPVMMVGALVCVLCGFFYPLVNTVFLFLFLRLIHGFSTGFKPTGTAAFIADVVPVTRRGEAMGIYGFVTSTGMAFGPYMGSWIAEQFNLDALFYTSSAFAFLSVAILVSMKETLPPEKREGLSLASFKVKWNDIFHPAIWPVAVVVFLSTFGYGAVLTLTPDLSKVHGLENKGIYFLIFTLASLLTRILGGKISDKKGRVNVLIAGALIMVLALGLTSVTSHVYYFYLGGFFFGIAWGIISPSYQAWTVDLCTEETRGRAVATMYIALEAGIGSGAILPMFLYNNKPEQIGWAFQLCLLMAAFAFIFLMWYKRKYKVA
ncbi:MFS transporter [Jiulongibacter sediminis]|uniref:MFS transporter n=2 Tax=Jiulongibacter sediminis TaxID=1605367 RepID=A0A0P7C3J9_9BACT|nr:MFS transporter [Jiulongibacter sediminis]KPM48889.1 MFS transporter [Jiulongibacter sediminis]TBX25419.1 MFS transporter [Jiulongibacter sediminis]